MLIIFYIKLFNKNEKTLSAIFGFSLLFCNRLFLLSFYKTGY
nr:MAG TPA: hypothetical protein [Caudoviricetes sp.]